MDTVKRSVAPSQQFDAHALRMTHAEKRAHQNEQILSAIKKSMTTTTLAYVLFFFGYAIHSLARRVTCRR